jgi:hypothetical protein
LIAERERLATHDSESFLPPRSADMAAGSMQPRLCTNSRSSLGDVVITKAVIIKDLQLSKDQSGDYSSQILRLTGVDDVEADVPTVGQLPRREEAKLRSIPESMSCCPVDSKCSDCRT